MAVGEARVRHCRVRLKRNSSLKVIDALVQSFGRALVPVVAPGFVKLFGVQHFPLFIAELETEPVRDTAGEPMMGHHQVCELDLFLLSPDAGFITRIDELGAESYQIISLAEPADHYGADAQLAADGAGINLSSFVLLNRTERDHP